LEQLPDLLTLVSATQLAMQCAIQVLASEEVKEPEPDRPVAGPAERARAHQFLSELFSLLVASNLAVLERFAQRDHLLDALSKADVEALQVALQSLNLEQARHLCAISMQGLALD
jgi:hypothetical protein